jgi:hypothetical protein
MLGVLNICCKKKALYVNVNKSKIMHFRNPSVPRNKIVNFSLSISIPIFKAFISSIKLLTYILNIIDDSIQPCFKPESTLNQGGAKIFGVFRVKNHEFTPKNHIFPILGGTRESFGVFHVKNHDFTPKKSYFFAPLVFYGKSLTNFIT